MAEYKATARYAADVHYAGSIIHVSFKSGDVVELDEAVAGIVNHEMPGTLTPVHGAKPSDRMMRPDMVEGGQPPETTSRVTAQINATSGAVRYAKKHGVDLSGVRGSGTGGKITLQDVKALVED